MRRADYWLLFLQLCESNPAGVDIWFEDYFWHCRVRSASGVRTGKAHWIGDAIEVVARNLAQLTIAEAR